MNMDSYKTFKCFCNLILTNEFTMNIYQFKMKMVNTYTKYFEYLLKEKYSNVYKHLRKLNVQCEIFLVEWFFTMFGRAFSLPVVINIWDLYLYYGEIVFFKTAICIFNLIENEIT